MNYSEIITIESGKRSGKLCIAVNFLESKYFTNKAELIVLFLRSKR